jgi:hypothetical protein
VPDMCRKHRVPTLGERAWRVDFRWGNGALDNGMESSVDNFELPQPSDVTEALLRLGEDAVWQVNIAVGENRKDPVSELVDAHAAAALASAQRAS